MTRTTFAAVFAPLAIATTALAGPAKPVTAWASGQLQRVDVAARSVVVMQGTHEMTFALAPDAQLTQGHKTLQASDLSGDIGRTVKVRYVAAGTIRTADRISVAESAAKTAAK
jgi:hypothetical protein